MSLRLCCFLLLMATDPGLCQQQMLSFPIGLPPTVTISCGQTCPSQDAINTEHRRVRNILEERSVIPCSCGGDGWTRVAYLNMSDPNQQCPSNWTLTTSPVRGCGRSYSYRSFDDSSLTCDSVFYPVLGRTYSSVCGRVLAYQKGVGAGFGARYTIDAAYVSGVSVTHGPAGSRQHIWTFAAAQDEQDRTSSKFNCPCTNTKVTRPYQVPSFIGNDYFCDTGNRGPGFDLHIDYPDDPLWDGEGCGCVSSCCEFNNPPWFCKSLPQPTSDDLELRLCNYLDLGDGEDKVIYLVDIFIKWSVQIYWLHY